MHLTLRRFAGMMGRAERKSGFGDQAAVFLVAEGVQGFERVVDAAVELGGAAVGIGRAFGDAGERLAERLGEAGGCFMLGCAQ